jgi:transposase InsO family protein
MWNIPERRLSNVATDLFSISGGDYLVLVDTYSIFIEVDHLISASSEEVIHKLNSHFARHGRPDMVISNNGPQYSSAAFAQFAHDWRFQHQTSSAGDSQSNGAA